ncbi:MAG: triose-phosphate isomerase [Nevskiaceae bacterium]|jgi:triosephosphate isomerase|nr:triose-phosphate isomerase [Nevskiaceae bacterium]
MNTTAARRRIVAGNWKMHGSRAETQALLDALLAPAQIDERVTCIVFPPFVYLSDAARTLRGQPIHLGAQDVCAEAPGAYTGEVAAPMLRDVGCDYVLVGHSERRALYGEDDALVARKFAAAQANKLLPILCVGETLAERDADQTYAVVGRQLDAVIAVSGVAALAQAVVAYEPVWAIGTGRTATPQQAQDVHAFIRGRVAALDAKIAAGLRILYGGSVKAGNARELFTQPDVDGGLIGGASLKADEFLAIWSAALADRRAH